MSLIRKEKLKILESLLLKKIKKEKHLSKILIYRLLNLMISRFYYIIQASRMMINFKNDCFFK